MRNALIPFMFAAVAATPTLAQERGSVPVEAGEQPARQVVAKWAEARGQLLTVDPQVPKVSLVFARDAELDLPTLRAVLDAQDLVLVEGGGDTLRLVHRRNLAEQVSPPFRLVEGPIPDTDEVITAVLPVRHGAGAQIFATLRGLISRDANRIGNAFFLDGAGTILVVDFAHKARYYQQVVERLDRPAGSVGVELRLYELSRARWDALREQHQGDALWRALGEREQAGEATLLEAADLSLQGEDFAVSRDTTLANGDQFAISLGLAQLSAERGGQLQLQLQIVLRGAQRASRDLRLVLPERLGEGLWVQAAAGRELDEPTQFVLLLRPER